MYYHYELRKLRRQLDEPIYSSSTNNIKVEVPSWIQYFLCIAKVVSLRSKDAQTQVGCVITSTDNRILATGYNSFPARLPDEELPNIRPEKYPFMLHAEMAAILNMQISPHMIPKGINIYLTMIPCFNCFKFLLNSNVRNIYFISKSVSKQTNENRDKFYYLYEKSNINIFKVNYDFAHMKKLLNR